MEILGIFISLALLMFIAYRGYSVILFAPVLALFAAFLQGLPVMPSYTELFMGKAVTYVKAFFPIFLLGAVFGKVMEDTGLAKSIAHAILAVVLACAVLTYGGVSLFVVAFAVYPFAAALFKGGNIPKRLIPGSIALGSFTFTMTALPGTPQIQNVIPGNFYGTNIFAAPITGIVAAIIIFVLGWLWLDWRRKRAIATGEGYGKHRSNEPEPKAGETFPSWRLAILPLILVVMLNLILPRLHWDPHALAMFQAMKIPLLVPAVKNVVGIWSLIIALVCGILLAIAIGGKQLPKGGGLRMSLNAGAIGSLLAIMNTASEVGYGNVIASLPGFKVIASALLGIQIGGSPLASEAVTVNILSGITGSASGGMSIALDIISKDWLAWANSIGMSPEILHRIASLASGGMDTMPHNGAVITLLAICGLTHRESYLDIFMTSVVFTVATGFLMILFNALTGLV